MAERGLIGATDSPNTLSIKDYVGLMYPSDYFYGRYNTNCDSNTFSNLPIEIVVGIMSGEVSDTFTEEQLICLESNWTLDVSQYDFNGGTDLLMTSPSEFVEATLLAAILNGGQITEMSKEQYEQMYQTFGPPTFIGVMGILITPMPSGLGLLMRDSMFYRPTIYLESDVLIESGDGSMENPYIISPQ